MIVSSLKNRVWAFPRPLGIHDLKKISNEIEENPTIEKRSKAKIVIIDDNRPPILEELRSNGFDISYENDIDDIRKIQPYFIILCDINGVGLSLNKQQQGAHIISECKKSYPEKIIIAYTGGSRRSNITQLAIDQSDYFMKKDVDLSGWISQLDDAVVDVLDPYKCWLRIRQKIVTNQDLSAVDLLKLEHFFTYTVINSNANFSKDELNNFIKNLDLSSDVRAVLQSIIASAIFSFFTGS